MNVLVFKNFLDADTCNQLNEWVDLGVEKKWLDKGLNRGTGWQYSNRLTTRNYADRFEYPTIVYDVFNKITTELNVKDLHKSVSGGGKDGIVVSCIFNDGDTYAHIDPKEGELEVLRCNVMTRSAEEGGELFVGGNKIDINVGDLHCYLPSTIEHYVTKVKGQTPRVLWMFGYQCSQERFDRIKNENSSICNIKE
jgi:hypothetical protein